MVSPLERQPFFGGWPHPQKQTDSTEEGLGLFLKKNMMLGVGWMWGELGRGVVVDIYDPHGVKSVNKRLYCLRRKRAETVRARGGG